MIVLNLSCHVGHRFEAWFSSREAFDDQSRRGLVACAHCQATDVSVLPSAPYVRRTQDSLGAVRNESVLGGADAAVAQMYKALAAVARGAENVGERFPEEARRIHYDEAPARTIRGIASKDETRALLEEGILVLPALVPPDTETH